MQRAFVFKTMFICITNLAMMLFGLQTAYAVEDVSRADVALEKLVKQLGKLESFAGSFVQFSVDQKGTRIQESRGEFKARRPGLFYWHTEQPLEQTIYSNGSEVTVYDPDLEQATVQQIDPRTQITPAILFSGDITEIGKHFKVELNQRDELVAQYLLTPKTQDSLFVRLRVRFEGSALTEMRLTDALGQESTVSFIQMQVNLDLPESAFIPDLPPGTDIIRDIPVVNMKTDPLTPDMSH